MNKQYVTADELVETLGVSKGKAYQIIRQLNDELAAEGFVYSDRVEHSARRFRADLSPFQSNLSALLSTPFRKSSAYLSGDECNDRFNIPPESLFRAL